jgi:mono/diheme cytochrome c family protein
MHTNRTRRWRFAPGARCLAVSALLLVAVGCDESKSSTTFYASAVSAGQYPLRTEFMVVGKTGLDGAPKHWPSAGFPPLKSAQFPRRTPDWDLAEDIRKQLGKTVLDPTTDLDAAQANLIARQLDLCFGIPAEPRVQVPGWEDVVVAGVARPKSDLGVFGNLEAIAAVLPNWEAARWKKDWTAATVAKAELKLDDLTLARGSVVYRRWCLQCHGLTGGGNGEQAIQLMAMPRDYRQGIFKFITAFAPPGQARKGLNPSGKPRRADLKRTIRHGLDGSMMPPFTTLSEAELEDLVSYVIHLSVRGETEFATMARAMQPSETDPDLNGPELEWLFIQNFLSVLNNWSMAERNVIPVPPEFTRTADDRLVSAFRGYKYYNSAEFGCGACHINYGREPALKWDMWGSVVQPRNLTLGVYRGGRRGEDLYARLYGGIYPSGMTAFHTALATGPSYPDRPNKIWNVVHFLQALGDSSEREQLKDPLLLLRIKERLKADGDSFLEDISAVKIEP